MNQLINTSICKIKSGRHQVSVYNSTTQQRTRRNFKLLAEAEYYEQSIKEQFIANGTNDSSTKSVAFWMKTYLEVTPNAFIKRMGEPMFLSFIDNFGHQAVMDVTRQHFINWLEELRVIRNYAQKTLPNIKSAVNQFFQFLVDANAVRSNPIVEIKIEKGEPKRARVVLAEDEIQDLLNRVKEKSSQIVYPVVFLLAHTGARLGEILKLKWSQVHFDLQAIHLLKTKNGDDRLIQVSPQVLEFLSSLPRMSDYVTLNIRSEPWTISQYNKQFRKIRRKVGFDKYWSNHSLRHSFATNYQKQSGDMNQLQKILGHHDLTMTVELYGQVNAEDILMPSPFDF